MSVPAFKNAVVRDLAWACFGPAMMRSPLLASGEALSNCGLALTSERRTWLQDLDRDPAALLEKLSTLASPRLGERFEKLWHFFLEQDPRVELIANNLAIREDGRTLGEFDCLYYCRERQQHFHLELAIKFFLSWRRAPSAANAWGSWLGPNSNDRLDLKIEHLVQHQSRLSLLPEAAPVLSSLGITSPGREVEIKGSLFNSLEDPLPPPPGFNGDRIRYHWLRIRALSAYLDEHGGTHFAVLKKPQWLAPQQLHERIRSCTRYGLEKLLQAHFEQYSLPRLVAAFDPQGRELRRFFVTGVDWPARHGQPPSQA